MQGFTMTAVGYEGTRERVEAIVPLSTFAIFFCDPNVLNEGVTAMPQRFLAFISLERLVRSAKTLRDALFRASFYPNRWRHTA